MEAIFSHPEEIRGFGPQAMETAARWKPWKTNRLFSTVPTALGKLG